MSWTSTNILRKHLQDTGVSIDSVVDEHHVLIDEESEQLAHAYITDDSEKVKTIDSNTPYFQGSCKLAGTSWKSLDYEQIVPGTVVVASDTFLTTIYIEGVDYTIDYPNGKIRRDGSGSIIDGGTVYVWYQYYTVHTRDSDYTFEKETGAIARIEGGGIANGSQVWVDYELDMGSVTDGLMEQAIIEAEDKILTRLSADYSGSSTDQGLKTGATELTLSIVAREMAAEAMRIYPSTKAAALSEQWRKLSLRFEQQAWKTLSMFLAMPELRGARAYTNPSFDND
jgi:hypothetical protein